MPNKIIIEDIIEEMLDNINYIKIKYPFKTRK